ncbi:MAG: hypothetical protein R3C68_02395 [Myxococcota bacterium]
MLNGILNNTRPEVLQRHWAGDGDVLEKVRSVVEVIDRMLDRKLWRKIVDLLPKRPKP